MPQPLTNAINALTTYANTVTGASDTTLSDAVATLASGYGGGGNKEAEILSGTLSGAYENTTVTKLKNYALADEAQMTSVSLPALASAGNSAFQNCTALTTVALPEMTSIGTYCFSGCNQLNNVVLPKLTLIQNNAFQNCTALTSASFPSATQINNSGLRNCRFSSVVFLNVTKTDTYCLSDNPNLISVDFPKATQFAGGSMFINDTSFSMLVIRSASVVPITATNHFNNTPFASGKAGGTLYVPQALISSYQSANNWSTILGYANNSIKSIESTHTDPNAPIDLTLYYADGTPIQ